MEELQRQRALLQEHLRWLESEIAAETSATLNVPAERAGRTEAPRIAPNPPVAQAAEVLAPQSSELPEPNVRGIHSEVRSGCLLYFGLACTTFGLVVAYIYWRY